MSSWPANIDQAGVAFKDRDFAMDGWSQVNTPPWRNQPRDATSLSGSWPRT